MTALVIQFPKNVTLPRICGNSVQVKRASKTTIRQERINRLDEIARLRTSIESLAINRLQLIDFCHEIDEQDIYSIVTNLESALRWLLRFEEDWNEHAKQKTD